MFDKATLSLGTTKVTSNVALRAGSSQQGNARRASVGYKKKNIQLKCMLHVQKTNKLLYIRCIIISNHISVRGFRTVTLQVTGDIFENPLTIAQALSIFILKEKHN